MRVCVIDHFHSNLLHSSGLSGQRVRYSGGKYSKYYTNHPDVSQPFFFFFCEENCRGWHQSQKYTAEIKMSAGHWTPHSCDEEKQGGLQSQHNFLYFSRKKKGPLAGFALSPLTDWGALLKRPPAVLLLEDIIFFSSGNNDLMSSKCPPSEVLMSEACCCWGVWGSDQRSPADKIALLTLDIGDWCRMWPWNPTGVVVLLILLATMSGCLFSVVNRPALLQCKSNARGGDAAEQQCNDTLGLSNWILVLFVETTIYRMIPIWLSSDRSDIEYYTLGKFKLW